MLTRHACGFNSRLYSSVCLHVALLGVWTLSALLILFDLILININSKDCRRRIEKTFFKVYTYSKNLKEFITYSDLSRFFLFLVYYKSKDCLQMINSKSYRLLRWIDQQNKKTHETCRWWTFSQVWADFICVPEVLVWKFDFLKNYIQNLFLKNHSRGKN